MNTQSLSDDKVVRGVKSFNVDVELVELARAATHALGGIKPLAAGYPHRPCANDAPMETFANPGEDGIDKIVGAADDFLSAPRDPSSSMPASTADDCSMKEMFSGPPASMPAYADERSRIGEGRDLQPSHREVAPL